MGGVVVDGTYVLTSVVVHQVSPSPNDPTPGKPMKITVGIAGNQFQSVAEQQKTVFRTNGTHAYDGTTTTTTYDCEHPSPTTPSPPRKVEYSATPTSIVQYVKETKDVTLVMTFTRL
jgi:hypothetical protein